MDDGRRTKDGGRAILGLFADILEYPRPNLIETVRECEALLAPENPEAAALLGEFRTLVQRTPLGQLEEIYTSAFDLDAACYPYVGYHLFGESYKRSVFLLELKERYRAQGFTVENELPDHLAVLLRFLALSENADLAGEIVHEAIVPALERMTRKAPSAGYDEEEPFGSQDHRRHSPYHGVLEALRLVLQGFPANDQGRMTKGEGLTTNSVRPSSSVLRR